MIRLPRMSCHVLMIRCPTPRAVSDEPDTAVSTAQSDHPGSAGGVTVSVSWGPPILTVIKLPCEMGGQASRSFDGTGLSAVSVPRLA